MRRGWWERRGFSVAEETRVPPEQAQQRRQAIEAIAAGDWDENAWDVKSYRFNVERVRELASDPSWRAEYDKDYVMACDVSA